MNKLILALALASSMAELNASSQDQAPPSAAPTTAKSPSPAIDQITFDLNFAGGDPADLVAAIEKASGRPLNALIPENANTVRIPAMKFKAVTVPDIFAALRMASRTTETINGASVQTYYGFQTEGRTPDSIWYFQYLRPPSPQEFCRFYQLAEDLQNYSIQDITTAVQTGWKMLGVKSLPQLKFHPETKLLIAVGPAEQLRTIDDVLRELRNAVQPRKSSEKKDGTPGKP